MTPTRARPARVAAAVDRTRWAANTGLTHRVLGIETLALALEGRAVVASGAEECDFEVVAVLRLPFRCRRRGRACRHVELNRGSGLRRAPGLRHAQQRAPRAERDRRVVRHLARGRARPQRRKAHRGLRAGRRGRGTRGAHALPPPRGTRCAKECEGTRRGTSHCPHRAEEGRGGTCERTGLPQCTPTLEPRLAFMPRRRRGRLLLAGGQKASPPQRGAYHPGARGDLTRSGGSRGVTGHSWHCARRLQPAAGLLAVVLRPAPAVATSASATATQNTGWRASRPTDEPLRLSRRRVAPRGPGGSRRRGVPQSPAAVWPAPPSRRRPSDGQVCQDRRRRPRAPRANRGRIMKRPCRLFQPTINTFPNLG